MIVGQGDTKEAALEDVKSAIQFHVETFGEDVLENADNFYSNLRNHNSVTNQSEIHPHYQIAPKDDR